MRRFICTAAGCNEIVEREEGSRLSPRCHKHTQSAFAEKKTYHSHHYDGSNRYIYRTTRWRSLRQLYISQHPLCEHCLRIDKITAAKEIDHIKEIRDGGEPYDEANLQALCTPCHRKKTAQEHAKRVQRKKLNGFKSIDDF